MADYLTNIITHTFAPEQVVQPRLPHVFHLPRPHTHSENEIFDGEATFQDQSYDLNPIGPPDHPGLNRKPDKKAEALPPHRTKDIPPGKENENGPEIILSRHLLRKTITATQKKLGQKEIRSSGDFEKKEKSKEMRASLQEKEASTIDRKDEHPQQFSHPSDTQMRQIVPAEQNQHDNKPHIEFRQHLFFPKDKLTSSMTHPTKELDKNMGDEGQSWLQPKDPEKRLQNTIKPAAGRRTNSTDPNSSYKNKGNSKVTIGKIKVEVVQEQPKAEPVTIIQLKESNRSQNRNQRVKSKLRFGIGQM